MATLQTLRPPTESTTGSHRICISRSSGQASWHSLQQPIPLKLVGAPQGAAGNHTQMRHMLLAQCWGGGGSGVERCMQCAYLSVRCSRLKCHSTNHHGKSSIVINLPRNGELVHASTRCVARA
eukprot:6172557-Pleurochrysis_carterae.AAC.2